MDNPVTILVAKRTPLRPARPKKVSDERRYLSAGLSPGTNPSGGPKLRPDNPHSPSHTEPIYRKPGQIGGTPQLMSAGLTPGSSVRPPLPGGHKSRGQKIRRLEQQLAEVRRHRKELEEKQREVPGGVGVSQRPGDKTLA